MFRFEFTGPARTKKVTIKKWLNKINGKFNDLMLLRIADRKANTAKSDRTAITREMIQLYEVVQELTSQKESRNEISNYIKENARHNHGGQSEISKS